MRNDESVPIISPRCSKLLIDRIGKFGKFLGCSGYPDCTYIYDLSGFTNIVCPDCEKRLRGVLLISTQVYIL